MNNTIIHTNNLSKFYGVKKEIKAVDTLNLDIYEGETFGLLGPNGAGKTTTVRMLNCIIKPTNGTATVNGHDILQDPEQVKRSTGLLAEATNIYEKLSAYEFLEFMGGLYDVPNETLRPRISELLRLFKLYERRDYLLETYSQGMKQKMLIASALIHDPPILFLDEPTSTLDPRSALMVKELINDLEEMAGKTIFLCSHILSVVEDVCDRVGIIHDGQLISIGTIQEVLTETDTDTLEEAFISLTGGIEKSELLKWRRRSDVNA